MAESNWRDALEISLESEPLEVPAWRSALSWARVLIESVGTAASGSGGGTPENPVHTRWRALVKDRFDRTCLHYGPWHFDRDAAQADQDRYKKDLMRARDREAFVDALTGGMPT